MSLFEWLFGQVEAGWHSMDSAPRDGTPIEIRCSYGYEPWVQVGRYAMDNFVGPIWEFRSGGFKTYVNAVSAQSRANGASEYQMKWRPTSKPFENSPRT